MATVSILLKKNKEKANGDLPVYLRITKNRKTQFISLKLYVHPTLWDDKKQRVKKKYPNSARINNYLAQQLAEAQSKAFELESKNKSSSGKTIKESIVGASSKSFLDYLESYKEKLKKNGKAGTFDKVNAVHLKLSAYLKGSDLTFEEFDLSFLRKYESYLRDKLENTTNTVHSNLKIFRKLFYDAEREDLVEMQNNPFRKHSLAWEKVEKTYLTESELAEIESLTLNAGSKIEQHRDLFVFACYAGGIRISDLLKLKWRDFDGTNIRFFTQKTKDHVSIKIPQKALLILKKYQPSDKEEVGNRFVFPFLKSDTDYSDEEVLLKAIGSATAYANKNLKTLAERTSIKKVLTFHSSRHTWATRALQKGISVAHVSKLMGHGSLKTTMGYVKIVNKDLDEAMDVFNT